MNELNLENKVWVYAQARNDHIVRVSLELLGKSVELGEQLRSGVTSVLIGSGVQHLSEELSAHGADTVFLLDDPSLKFYQNEVYANLLTDLIQKYKPEIFMMGATDIGSDLAPRIAAKLNTGLTAHCVDLKLEEHDGILCLHQVVPGWGCNIMADIICPHRRPQMSTVKPGVFDLSMRTGNKKAEVIEVAVKKSDKVLRTETIEVYEEKQSSLSLEKAEIIIAAGWGVHVAGVYNLVEELAEVIGGEIGGTRPMADRGYVPVERMIGQSGKTVSPKILISLGASGAMHFTTGFTKSKHVIAVDQNPKAPIFDVADIGISGDLRQILPCLIEELRKLKAVKGNYN